MRSDFIEAFLFGSMQKGNDVNESVVCSDTWRYASRSVRRNSSRGAGARGAPPPDRDEAMREGRPEPCRDGGSGAGGAARKSINRRRRGPRSLVLRPLFYGVRAAPYPSKAAPPNPPPAPPLECRPSLWPCRPSFSKHIINWALNVHVRAGRPSPVPRK